MNDTTTPPADFQVGDYVTVHDPNYGDKPGVVVAADAAGIEVDGPRLGPRESRCLHYSISPEHFDKVSRR